MSVMSLVELAVDPAAPTVSVALEAAAVHAAQGPIAALSRAVYGSANPDDYAAVTSPEHVLAWGAALTCTAGLVDPVAVPDGAQDAGTLAATVGNAHQVLTAWADGHTTQQLAHLFEAAAEKARQLEASA